MFNNLRNRLLIILVPLAVIPIFAVGWINLQRSFDTQRAQSLLLQKTTARLVANEIEQFILAREDELQQLGTIRGLGTMIPQEQQAILDSLIAHEQTYREIHLVNAQGEVVAYTSQSGIQAAKPTENFAISQVFVLPLVNQQIYYSEVREDEASGEPYMLISLPIYDLQTGNLAYVLIANFRFRPILDLIMNLELEQGQTVFVVDDENQIVAHRNPSVVLQGGVFDAEMGKARSDEKVILATDRIQFGEQKLTIVAEITEAQALKEARQGIYTIVVSMVLAFLIALALTLFMVRQIVIPIETLSKTAQAISSGDLSLQVQVKNRDEIGGLALAFNQMTARLQSSICDLEQNIQRLQSAQAQNEQLIRELRDALIFKDQFLATMSYELRSPLNAISGYTGIILMQKGLPETLPPMLLRIKENSQRLITLVNEVTNLAYKENIQLSERPVKLEKLVQKWHDSYLPRIREKNLDFMLVYDSTLPAMILGDEERLTQIVLSLLDNAAKFTEQGSIELAVMRDGDEWWIRVKDTGIGISEMMLPVIFDEFRKVHNRSYGGAGLGLSIAQKLTALMGGIISVESQENSGSTFTVKLPLKVVTQ